MDGLVDEACGYGRYQRVLLWLVLYPAQVSCGPQLYGQLLMFLTPDHWCRDGSPVLEAANSTQRLRLCASSINVSAACIEGYDYDRRFLGADETAVTQWDLVCRRRILATLSMFLFGIGLLAGHFLCVLVSHRWGQRACFTTFLFAQCLFGMLAALSSKFFTFVLLRTLVAVGTAGTWTSVSILVGDLAGGRHRAAALVCSRLAHGLGMLLLGLVSLAVRGWGHLAAATSVPFVAFLVYWRVLPNSPKWLLARGKIDQVEQLLASIAHTNGKRVDFQYGEKLRASITRMNHRRQSGTSPQYTNLPQAEPARRRVIVVLAVGVLSGGVSLAQVYLASSLAGNAYLHLLLMSCAELSACVAPLALVKRTGCGPVVFCGCVAGGVACLLHLALTGHPCLSLCLLAVAKASVSSSLAVLPAWLLENSPCSAHQLLTHLAQAAELAAFPIVPLVFPADSPQLTLVVLSAALACSSVLTALACDTRRVWGLWCWRRPDGLWGAWSWQGNRDLKCRSIAWEFKYPQVPSPIPSLLKRQEELKHDGHCNKHRCKAEVIRVTVV